VLDMKMSALLEFCVAHFSCRWFQSLNVVPALPWL